MISDIKKLLLKAGEPLELMRLVRDKKLVSAFNLHFYQRLLTCSIFDSFVYVCADMVAAGQAKEFFEAMDLQTVYLPPKDDALSFRQGQAGHNITDRLHALSLIAMDKARIVVTTPAAMAQLYPVRQKLKEHIIALTKGGDYDVYNIVADLTQAGYRRVEQVESLGQFALRGDILDIWALGHEPIRVEFFGDEVESIKYIDAEAQTSSGKLDGLTVMPFTDVFVTDGEAAEVVKSMRADKPSKLSPEFGARLDEILSEIELKLTNGDRSVGLSFAMPYIEHTDFGGFVNKELIIYDECKAVVDNAEVIYAEHLNRYKSLLIRGELLKKSVNQFVDKQNLYPNFPQKLAFHRLTNSNRIFTPDAVINFKEAAVSDYTRNHEMLRDDVNNWMRTGYDVVILAGSDKVKANIMELFDNAIVEGEGIIEISTQYLPKGAVLHELKLVVIGSHDITSRTPKKVIKRNKKDVFTAPNVGDFVVHNVHGIGVCESLTKMGEEGALKDYLVIRYRDNDRLYVPIENMDSLSKYIAGDAPPKLSKIGGKDFAALKSKVKASVKAMAVNLLDIYSERQNKNGHKYSRDNELFEEFCSSFPYSETADQLTAIDEGLEDLYDGKVMDRLLCGDVGYGKTEVALRLAFKVIEEGKQVAFLSPTTILARQHFNTVVKRMESFGIRTASLTRFDSAAQIKENLALISEGKIDIVCGTHRLLSKDVKFRDLGLLILDEEQRFGVADKEKIKDLKRDVNVLTLSATPIPRTLNMSMMGIRDISILDTPPNERIPVQTYVTEFTETLISDAISREVGRGGQVFIVYNRVETIDKFAAQMQSIMPDIKFSVAHGQMPEAILEVRIGEFSVGASDALISSTIIENGIDMPNANTMIVVDSDRLGLSQLYQLRGRVGRSNRLAYVYFTYDGRKILTEDAYKRLDAITQFTEFGSGFKIAMRDLEIRGAGNVLGREQHGHMEKVGYDMYLKLLSEAVMELKGEKKEDDKEVKVLVDYSAYIPDGYIKDGEWRLKLYSKIASVKTKEERDGLCADMKDIYGALPAPVDNLLTIALVKNLAAAINASYVVMKRNKSVIAFDKAKDIPSKAATIRECVLDSEGLPIIKFNNNAELVNFLLKA